jgi:hypothetical protein
MTRVDELLVEGEEELAQSGVGDAIARSRNNSLDIDDVCHPSAAIGQEHTDRARHHSAGSDRRVPRITNDLAENGTKVARTDL